MNYSDLNCEEVFSQENFQHLHKYNINIIHNSGTRVVAELKNIGKFCERYPTEKKGYTE